MELLGSYDKFTEAAAFMDGYAEREPSTPISRLLDKIVYDEFILTIKKYKNKFIITREWI